MPFLMIFRMCFDSERKEEGKKAREPLLVFTMLCNGKVLQILLFNVFRQMLYGMVAAVLTNCAKMYLHDTL